MTIVATLAAALVLPGFTQVAVEPSGATLLQGTFPGTQRAGYVYLPPTPAPGRRYPVVYLLHGMPGSPSEFVDGAGLARFGAQAAASGVPPFIAVMPAAGPDPGYNGEWAGPWETALVRSVVPWVDTHLPTIRGPTGRVLAGLSAGGYGAVDIGIRNLGIFGTIESWGGYFTPLHDGPFEHAGHATLAENDATLLARAAAGDLRRSRVRFFLSSGPAHSHWFRPQATVAFARELHTLGVPVALRLYTSARGQWSAQLEDGLTWALTHSVPHTPTA